MSYDLDLRKSKRWKDKRGNIIDIVKKMKNHFYHHSAKGYATGDELYDEFFKFFDHIIGVREDPAYEPKPWELNDRWREQVRQLREEVQSRVKAEQFDKLTHGMFTSWIESFHSACNLGAPKQKFFASTMQARMKLVEINWNRDKISSVFYRGNGTDSEHSKLEVEQRVRAKFQKEILDEMMRDGEVIKKAQEKPSGSFSIADLESMDVLASSPVTPAQRRSSRLSGIGEFLSDSNHSSTQNTRSSKRPRQQ